MILILIIQDYLTQKENHIKLYRLIGIGFLSELCALPLALQLSNKGQGININRLIFLELSLAVPFFFGLVIILAIGLYHTKK